MVKLPLDMRKYGFNFLEHARAGKKEPKEVLKYYYFDGMVLYTTDGKRAHCMPFEAPAGVDAGVYEVIFGKDYTIFDKKEDTEYPAIAGYFQPAAAEPVIVSGRYQLFFAVKALYPDNFCVQFDYLAPFEDCEDCEGVEITPPTKELGPVRLDRGTQTAIILPFQYKK